MRYGILGPVGVLVNGAQASGGRPRERRVLAALLLDANRVVSTGRLVDVLWDDAPPRTARAQIRNVIAAVRQHLGAAIGRAAPITRVGGGYIMEVGEGELDLHVFEGHIEQAQRLADAGQLERASDTLRAGLALWRGPALGGTGDSILDVHASRLEEQRLACVEQRIELDLALGRQRGVVGELKALVTEYPLRERLVELDMIALSLCGRRQDALDVFASARAYLNEHAGLDPRRELTELQQAILRGDPLPPRGRDAREAPPRLVALPSPRDGDVPQPERSRPGLRLPGPSRAHGSPMSETERLRAENALLRAELNRIRSGDGVDEGYAPGRGPRHAAHYRW